MLTDWSEREALVPEDIELRAVHPADRSSIIALLATSLGRDDDPRFEALYAWKHELNCFGPSCIVVAVAGDQIVGFRALMRWQFRSGERTIHAVRAVDTATHPGHRGRGIFTRLTRRALELVQAEGTDFIFNTPNDQSRPGYMKMGWREVGRLQISVRPSSLTALPKLLQARVPAERWSEPCNAGEPAEVALQENEELGDLLASQPRSAGIETSRSPAYLQWRYAVPPLGYRVLTGGSGVADGVVVFRVRRRGAAREIVLDEVLVPGGARGRAADLLKRLATRVSGDYIIRAGGSVLPADGFLRLPRQGPILTWRHLCETRMPTLAEWDLTMGDIELF
jgi:GNAT superfamily N-acetyltransferase